MNNFKCGLFYANFQSLHKNVDIDIEIGIPGYSMLVCNFSNRHMGGVSYLCKKNVGTEIVI